MSARIFQQTAGRTFASTSHGFSSRRLAEEQEAKDDADEKNEEEEKAPEEEVKDDDGKNKNDRNNYSNEYDDEANHNRSRTPDGRLLQLPVDGLSDKMTVLKVFLKRSQFTYSPRSHGSPSPVVRWILLATRTRHSSLITASFMLKLDSCKSR